MHRILPFCIASIFLFAAFSIESAAQEDSNNALSSAVECEYMYFISDDPDTANKSLIRKSEHLLHAELYKEASETLERVSIYMLDEDMQEEVLLRKEICYYLCGDFEAAASIRQMHGKQMGIKPELEAIVLEMRKIAQTESEPKKETTAMALAFFPPLGQFYTHNFAAGFKAMVLNGGAVAWTVAHLLSSDWINAFLAGGIALNRTFMNNQNQSISMVSEYNNNMREQLTMQMKSLYRNL